MKVLNTLAMILLVMGLGCHPSAQTFNYHLAQPPAEANDRALYNPPASDAILANISGNEVRNVIVCIGDGMGFNHVAMARHQGAGAARKLYMELLPVRGQVTTRSANSDVTDSAAAATALACGIKTDNGMIGMSHGKTAYSSILELLGNKGWRTGLVATSTITHATPAAFASHVASRKSENDIAVMMLENRVDVLFGGGRKYWSDSLLAQAVADGYQIIKTRDQMLTLKPGPVIGLFADDGMKTYAPEPSLSEMSKIAIELLSSPGKEWFSPNPRMFIMVEGSQIDWAAHANDTERAVRQTLMFDMAVHEAIEFARRDGHTLVIVTADHETGGLVLKPKDNGIEAKWTTHNHTAANVPLFAYGPGSEKFAGTIANIDIPKRIAELTGIAEFPVVKSTVRASGSAIQSRKR